MNKLKDLLFNYSFFTFPQLLVNQKIEIEIDDTSLKKQINESN